MDTNGPVLTYPGGLRSDQLLPMGWQPGKKHPIGKRLLQIATMGAYNPDDRFASGYNKNLIALDAQNAMTQRALEGQLRAAGDEEARRDTAAFKRKQEQGRLTEAEAQADYMRKAETMGISPEEAQVQWAHWSTLAKRGDIAKGTATMLEDINRASGAAATAPLAGALAIKNAFAEGARADANEALANTQAATAPGITQATNAQNNAITRALREKDAVENPYDTIKRLQQELADRDRKAAQDRATAIATAPMDQEAAIDAARTRAAVERSTAEAASTAENLGPLNLAKIAGIPLAPGSTLLTPGALKSTNNVQAQFRPMTTQTGFTEQYQYDPSGNKMATIRTPNVPGMAPTVPNLYGNLIPIDMNVLSNILSKPRP